VAGPLEQFKIQPLLDFEVAGYNLAFTNSSLWMIVAVISTLTVLVASTGARSILPGRLQSLGELSYDFLANMIRENAGPQARAFFPFVFSLFMFILVGNSLGMIPGAFTFTSHIIVTFGLAMIVFTMVTILGFMKHGLHFLTFFVPSGVSPLLGAIIIPIELISYLSRPVSLSIRLFANMMAGHTMMKVFAGFSVTLGAAFGAAGYGMGILPIVINVALVGFEFLVAFLQAYVFSILTCLYIRDALELH
jgi:F-type H+-transporting ATPase subunit a